MKRILLLGLLAALAQAHVGSPDVYLDGKAGPYELFVTVRPPVVIPGVAEVEVRSETPGVKEIRAAPLPMAGAGAKFAPVPDKLAKSPRDAQFFTGSLWMMASGSWQVRLTVDGDQGRGVLAIPVPSVALATKKMQRGLGILLACLGVFLVAGLVMMTGASAREAKLSPGAVPNAANKRRGRIAMSVAFVIVIAVVWFGDQWWNNDATAYADRVYKPLAMKASIDSAGVLNLDLEDTGWMSPGKYPLRNTLFVRRMDDFVPDHNHLMHLYAIREPGMDVVYHLHPELSDRGVFREKLPSMEPGTYRLYADVVHANGFPETMVATIDIPDVPKRPLTGDDAGGETRPWTQGSPSETTFTLPDGYRMQWIRDSTPLRARQATPFRFRLLDPEGHAPKDMELYMGMLGHAAFVKTDGTTFAHIHPTGSVAMAAFMMVQKQPADMKMDMSGMEMPDSEKLPNEVMFPYGFPSPGRYRIFVQMKRGGKVETGIFDADVK